MRAEEKNVRVLVACEFSGIVRDAFAARGHEAWSCDLLPSERPGQHIQADVRTVLGDEWDLLRQSPNGRNRTMAGVELIAAERQRQIDAEGWSPEHDDQHTGGELSWAASCYASVGSAVIRGATADEFPADLVMAEGEWPGDWGEEFWKPSNDPIRNLVKAGALIAAEIDRIQRGRDRYRGAWPTE